VFEFILHIGIMACLYGLLAISLNLQFGFGGLANFGQMIFFACGAYGAGIALLYGWGTIAGYGFGLLATMIVGAGMASIGRSLSADYWGIATLATAEAARILIMNAESVTGGAQGIGGLPPLFAGVPRSMQGGATLLLCVAILAATWAGCRLLTTSRYGLGLKLMREEPQLARSLGYDLGALRRQIMIVSGAIASTAGFLFAHYVGFVGPDQFVGAETFLIWTMIIVGGLGNHLGAIAGAVLLQSLFAFVPFVKHALDLPSQYVAAMRLVLVGGGLLVFLMYRPAGLLPERIGKPAHG
jgi:branched-chain amino acid transport system permease protein